MKLASVDKFMLWSSTCLIALIVCWYKEPQITDFLCTAMSMFCALFSALTVAEMRDAKNQIEQKSSDPESNTSERMNQRPVRNNHQERVQNEFCICPCSEPADKKGA